MTVATNSATIAGAHSLFVSRRNIYGMLNGFANLQATDVGIASEMRRVKGIEQIPNPIVQPTRVQRTYDDGPGRPYTYPGVSIPQGDLQFGIMDIDLENAAQGSTSWTKGNWKKTVRGSKQPIFSDMVVLSHHDSVSEDAATAGTPGYMNTLRGNVQLLPQGNPSAQAQQTAAFIYSMTLSSMSAWVDGTDFDNTNFTVDDGLSVSWWSLFPTLFGCMIGDGTATTITTGYTPVDAASTKVSKIVISGGVLTITAATITSVTPSTKAILLSAALTSGAFYIYEYEAARLVA